jgi:uncharacterized membrane protein YfcA
VPRRPDALRGLLIAILIVAAILSVVGKKMNSPFVGWVSFAVFLGAIAVYLSWRRAALAERRARRSESGPRENP